MRRDYKDSMFRMLYLDKQELLNLYNAVNGTDYTDTEGLEINTLQNAIYMNMKNDVSFLFNFQVNLYEHQSTVNPNIPLRDLFYVSDLLQNIVKDYDLYGRTLVRIPAPRFIVFYNGREKQPERRVYKLSDAFSRKQEEPELELMVTVLNINAGNNAEILGKCRTLREYMLYNERVRNYAKEMPIQEAVEQAVRECINEGILAEFLKRNRAEAIKVSIYEYNEELHLANTRREGYEDGVSDGLERGLSQGITQGITRSVIRLLEGLGSVPDSLKTMLYDQQDEETLIQWLKFASESKTVEEFTEKVIQ